MSCVKKSLLGACSFSAEAAGALQSDTLFATADGRNCHGTWPSSTCTTFSRSGRVAKPSPCQRSGRRAASTASLPFTSGLMDSSSSGFMLSAMCIARRKSWQARAAWNLRSLGWSFRTAWMAASTSPPEAAACFASCSSSARPFSSRRFRAQAMEADVIARFIRISSTTSVEAEGKTVRSSSAQAGPSNPSGVLKSAISLCARARRSSAEELRCARSVMAFLAAFSSRDKRCRTRSRRGPCRSAADRSGDCKTNCS
mmetsp:Transcript_24867/g.74182  ORF Transcript_24867/g.74182 Transcript_24867/m.74182 type:complete len:256 (-) Transcript_24867:870-1637(-)